MEFFDLKEAQFKEIAALARKNKLCSGKIGQNLNFTVVPDLTHPYIFIVLTFQTFFAYYNRRK